jgi:catechol 2,3-dioxygenase-like lactoylglutathione lyase family enzyme
MKISILELNHVAIHVKNVAESIHFYQNILEFEKLNTRPAFDFDGAWFRLGVYQELHIIEGRDYEVNSHSRKTHFALRVKSASETVAFLKSKNIEMIGPKPRPDGVIQIFITDPDGYWIEFTEI